MNWIAEKIDAHRRLISFVLLLISGFAFIGITRLKYALDPSNELKGRSEDHKLLAELYEEFSSDKQECILLVKGEDVFTPEYIRRLGQLSREIQKIEGVERVFGLDNVPVITGGRAGKLIPAGDLDRAKLKEARARALQHPLIAGYLLSPDAQATLLMVRLSGDLATISQVAPVVEQMRDCCRALDAAGVFEALVTGTPAVWVDMFRTIQGENFRLFIISATIAFVIALLLFRKISAIIIVSGAPLTGVLWTLGLLGWLKVDWTALSLSIPTMVYVIGFTDAVHLVIYMHRKMGEGISAREGALGAVRKIGWACALTSITTGIGFGSLVLSGSPIVRNLGFSCALGTIITFGAVIVIVPLLSGTFLGSRSRRQRSPKTTKGNRRFYSRMTDYPLTHPKIVSVIGVSVTLFLLSRAAKLRPDTGNNWIPRNCESLQAYFTYSKVFEGGTMIHVLLDWQGGAEEHPKELLTALKEIHTILEEEAATSYPVSALSLVEAITGSSEAHDGGAALLLKFFPAELINRFIHFDRRRALVTCRFQSVSAVENIKVFNRLEKALGQLSSQYDHITMRLTGAPVASSRTVYTIIFDLGKSLLLAIAIITATLIIAFGSIRYGLISIIPNILPLAAIGAFLVAAGQTMQVANTIVFTICLGIAVDDTIHFVIRYRRELRESGEPVEAARRSFQIVGKAIVITTVICVCGFGSVAVSTIAGYRLFAVLAGLGFITALIGDLFLLPALLICGGGRKRP